jgi:hypothetical protein
MGQSEMFGASDNQPLKQVQQQFSFFIHFNYEIMHGDGILRWRFMFLQDIPTILCCSVHIGY